MDAVLAASKVDSMVDMSVSLTAVEMAVCWAARSADRLVVAKAMQTAYQTDATMAVQMVVHWAALTGRM